MRWLLLALMLGGPAWAQDATLQLLKQPGAVGLMRHARAPGTGDPSGFRLGDCSTQRNLDAVGREHARQMGARMRAAVPQLHVLSSEWCRATETADLLDMGPVQALPALNSFYAESAAGPAQTEAVRRFIADWTGDPLLLVTHQVNITALTSIYPDDGELIVLLRGAQGHTVAGRVTPPRP